VKVLRWILGAALVVGALVAAVAIGLPYFAPVVADDGPTVGEKLGSLRAERAALQARADGEARLELLRPFRTASLLSDALMARGEADREFRFDRLPAERRQAFAAVQALNAALKDALSYPGEGTRQLVRTAVPPAQQALERLGSADDLPLVLQVSPRFVPPRRATGDLTLAPAPLQKPPDAATVALDAGGRPAASEPTAPTVPRYAPPFVAANDEDPPVAVEIVGLRLAADRGAPPTLAIGAWRGAAVVAPERLRFAVPRSAFTTETARTTFVNGVLSIRHESRTVTFDLLFTVLPDRPGSFALDQKVQVMVPESRTLVSPELLARGGPGETRVMHRCFDPPEGWRFDMSRRRVVVVDRLASDGDVPDPTLNGGSVEFADDGQPGQICVTVTARPATKTAKTATIGRFEATLVRDRAEDHAEHTGIRALDWREPAHLALDPAATEWKLYIRLFDEIDREYDGKTAAGLPFLHITADPDGKTLVLQADPEAGP
jgi:hypothetical protein